MEVVFVLCSLLFLFLIVKIVNKSNKPKTPKHKLPPGPRKLPIVGNIHQLFGSLPHHTLRDLATKHGPLMHIQLGEIPAVVISSPEIAQEVFRTHDIILSNRPYSQANWEISYNHSDIAFAPYGDLWRQLRKICTLELLTTKRVQTFGYIREDEVFKMMKSIFSNEEKVVNLSRKIFSLNYTIIARAAFGKRSKYHDEFIAAVESVMKMLGGFNMVEMFPSIGILGFISGYGRKLVNIHNQIDKIAEAIVKEHKQNVTEEESEAEERKDDLVDVLLNIQKQGDLDVPMTDKIIKAVIFDMFTAGGETSSTTIEWAISELIKNPTVMKRAQDEVRKIYNEKGTVDESMIDELKYLKAISKETLRLHPPAVLLVPRECSEQCEINGYEIPAKTTIFINAWAIGRDSKYWNDADKFDPDRFLESKIDYKGNHFQYVPFGVGRRICPGISFAIPSIQLSIAQLLFHFDWKLPGEMLPEELDMTEKYGLTVRRENDLHLIPIPYHLSCLKKEALTAEKLA